MEERKKQKRLAVTHHSRKSRPRVQTQPIKEYIRESISNRAQTNTTKTQVLWCTSRTFSSIHDDSVHAYVHLLSILKPRDSIRMMERHEERFGFDGDFWYLVLSSISGKLSVLLFNNI